MLWALLPEINMMVMIRQPQHTQSVASLNSVSNKVQNVNELLDVWCGMEQCNYRVARNVSLPACLRQMKEAYFEKVL